MVGADGVATKAGISGVGTPLAVLSSGLAVTAGVVEVGLGAVAICEIDSGILSPGTWGIGTAEGGLISPAARWSLGVPTASAEEGKSRSREPERVISCVRRGASIVA